MIAILGPPVEMPVEGDLTRGRAFHEDRPRVAHPAPVGRNVVKLDPSQIDLRFVQADTRLIFGDSVIEKDADDFTFVQMTDDLGVNPRDGSKLSRPVAAL